VKPDRKSLPRLPGGKRLYVVQDSDDPLLFLVTTDRTENAIRVLPTARALAKWDYRASCDDIGQHEPAEHPLVGDAAASHQTTREYRGGHPAGGALSARPHSEP
jgi:hypothetical protein